MVNCINCGKKLKGKQKKYCSPECSSIYGYYKNHKKNLERVRNYDRTHKEIKRAYDKKRRKVKDYNKKKYYQHYSQRHHFPILIEKFNGCQFCKSKERLQIHHKKYTNDIKDCLLLCEKCHKKLHRRVITSI